MAKDIIALLQCEGIYMLAGWEESQGARLEHALAKEGGLVVFYEIPLAPEGGTSG
nr:MAG TPA: protein of unknown function (DUF1937) [Caudoviricetes sp.]